MSQPQNQQEASGTGEKGTAPRGSIFAAYQEQKRPRSSYYRYFLLYPLAALVVLGLGVLFVNLEQEAAPIRVETKWGMRTVRLGMSPQEVSTLLGQPASKERKGNMECYQYGRPTINEPSFTLHVVCYEEGKLREVSEKRYNSWVVTQDGAIAPAPLEYRLTPELESPGPSHGSSPGIAGQPTP